MNLSVVLLSGRAFSSNSIRCLREIVALLFLIARYLLQNLRVHIQRLVVMCGGGDWLISTTRLNLGQLAHTLRGSLIVALRHLYGLISCDPVFTLHIPGERLNLVVFY